jgi:hypothetical protein
MTDSQTIRVKGTSLGSKFDRYSVPNVLVRGQPCWVHYVFYPEAGSYAAYTEGLPDILLLREKANNPKLPDSWCAMNAATGDILGASSLKTAFDFAVTHWWT